MYPYNPLSGMLDLCDSFYLFSVDIRNCQGGCAQPYGELSKLEKVGKASIKPLNWN